MSKIYFATLGCKLNESEIEAWSRQFGGSGYELVGDPREADLCILNTCTVTHIAARKSRQVARQLARANPNARLVLTGCYASMSPDEAKNLPNVSLVVPNTDKDRLVALAGNLLGDVRFQSTETGCRLPEAVSGVLQSGIAPSTHVRTRAFVKIMDGCNMSCTYCIIPRARGKETSRPLEEVIAEVRSLVEQGYQEIILTGVQISAYANHGDKAHGLRDLVGAILAETAVARLRLTSIAPWDLDESLLDLWRDPRLCRHLHLSLQSGSDTVLRRMRRAYTTAQFSRVAELARARIPDVGITTDVIVGFPGESEIEFDQSLRFVERMQFSRVHVFPYSAREGTIAANLPPHVSEQVKDARVRAMQQVADVSARLFAERHIGQTMQVLWESSTPLPTAHFPLAWSGYTDNYIRVTAQSSANLHNRISASRLTHVESEGAVGTILEPLHSGRL